jgi:hypothetical protein
MMRSILTAILFLAVLSTHAECEVVRVTLRVEGMT